MGTAVNHPVPDQVKPTFVIFHIKALSTHRMLYSCTQMTTVGFKGLIYQLLISCLSTCLQNHLWCVKLVVKRYPTKE